MSRSGTLDSDTAAGTPESEMRPSTPERGGLSVAVGAPICHHSSYDYASLSTPGSLASPARGDNLQHRHDHHAKRDCMALSTHAHAHVKASHIPVTEDERRELFTKDLEGKDLDELEDYAASVGIYGEAFAQVAEHPDPNNALLRLLLGRVSQRRLFHDASRALARSFTRISQGVPFTLTLWYS